MKRDLKIEAALESLKELEDLLTDRISDLHGIKTMVQARHAYILYRKVLWEAQSILKSNS